MLTPSRPLLIGVDGGGTGCRVAIGTLTDGVLARAEGGSANATSDPLSAIDNIIGTVNAAAKSAGIRAETLHSAYAHLGLAGAISDAVKDRILQGLPYGHAVVTDDRVTAVSGALCGADGYVLSIGTGSIVGATTGGTFRFVGGWGFQVSDHGSGAWLGRKVLEQVLLCHDGLEADGPLTKAVFARFDNDPNPVVAFCTAATPGDFATLAPEVIAHARAGDAFGQRLLQNGAEYLMRGLARLGFAAGDPLCLMGGLGPHYADYLGPETLEGRVAPQGTALDGAFALAHSGALALPQATVPRAKTPPADSQMRREILEIPAAVDRLLHNGGDDIRRAAEEIRSRSPAFMVSVARGSSDHVATYLKYASELLTGTAIGSIGPSIASVYQRQLHLPGSVCLSVSQSGKSPDIVAMARMARAGGALSVAMTNTPDSPLAQVADHSLNLHAGPELSVAATKSFVNSTVAGLWLLAECAEDDALRAAIRDLPAKLEQAVKLDWPEVRAALGTRKSLFCLGRGPAYAISNEAALKFKETCQIHAESYSSAEVLHGPVSLVDGGFPVIALAAQDAAEAPLARVADDLAAKGAQVFATSDKVAEATPLPATRTGHALTDPIALIASFYAMVERTAAARGINPDAPRHLRKVTKTV